MRYILSFLLRCIKYFCFEVNGITDRPDFYALLGIGQGATQDEIEEAYKQRRSKLHPDKLVQGGKEVTKEDQARYRRMKRAYTVLSNPQTRDVYNVIGGRGLEIGIMLDGIDRDFATSRGRVCWMIWVGIIGIIYIALFAVSFYVPYLVCLKIDGKLGSNASWVHILIPLWILNIIIIVSVCMATLMIEDRTQFCYSVALLFQVSLQAGCEYLVALKLDGTLPWTWTKIFIFILICEANNLVANLYTVIIMTEQGIKAFLESISAPADPSECNKVKTDAVTNAIRSCFRLVLELFVLLKLDGYKDWSWWQVFTPIWIKEGCTAFFLFFGFFFIRKVHMERYPNLFGKNQENDIEANTGNYGVVGKDGDATAVAVSEAPGKLELTKTEEEEEQLKEVIVNRAGICFAFCIEIFYLMILMIFVGRIQSASYSALWMLFPYTMILVIQLSFAGCIMFCP